MVADHPYLAMTVDNPWPFGLDRDRLRLEYTGLTLELFVDPSALTSSAIPSSPLPFLHPLPVGPQGVAYWDDDPVLQVFFTINDGGITPGPSEEPILPIDPSAPTWTMPPHFFPPPSPGCGELWWHVPACIQQHECFLNPNNCRFDPPLAIGFEYEMVDGPNIVLVIPPVVGDNTYTLRRFDGAPDVTIHGGEPYILEPAGVRKFQILGIETSAGIDSQDPTAFVTGIVTTEAGLGQLTMRPLTASPTPVASAGLDQVVNEGDPVTLDGSGSTDPQALPLTFTWSQVAGDLVTLNLNDPIHPTFIAPQVSANGATLSFQLVVSDEHFSSTPTTVNITVKNVNHPPVALVGPDQAVAEASLVTLDASANYDPDAEPLTYLWQQLSGPTVTLSDSTQAKPTFLAPLVGPTGMTLSFKLTVSDGQASADTTTNIQVTNVNHLPVANAGPDQTRNAGTTIQLDGTASTDPDSDPLTFTWSQLSGLPVTLSNVHSATPTFVGPQVSSSTTLTFQLLVDDGLGGTASADVNVTLLPVDAPPLCTHAKAHPQRLWPPDHKLADVKIVGVTDPDSRKVTLTVTHVTQDEPVGCIARRGSRDYDEDDDETRGCRHTTPDAIIHQDGHVALRAERREHGNGRVYHITFQADDGAGGQCTGQVTVCVPHDRHHPICVDDSQRYDATQR